MTSLSIPDFSITPIDQIQPLVENVKTTYFTNLTRPIDFRLKQLRRLYWGIVDNTDLLVEACRRDLHKSRYESLLTEIDWVKNDIIFTEQHLKNWAKDESPPDIPLIHKAMRPFIRKDPVGTVLIIGAFNFPVQLTLGPMIGAIAAGCTCVIKPSENSPASAMVMELIVKKYLDPLCYACVQGNVEQTTELLNQEWDKIFFTGSNTVGKIIARKASETLTPVILELGGQNTAIVTKHADPRLAARRLLWAKTLNAGQVCVSQNWTLVEREIYPSFLSELKICLKEFYPNGAHQSPDYCRIVSINHFRRLKKLLDASNGKILIGGNMDEDDLFIEPTVILVDNLDDPILSQETFGPILPIYVVRNLDEAITLSNHADKTPLGLYPFGNREEVAKILKNTRSGGVSINDGFTHATIPTLPFGGIGSSGQGAYRGRASFEAFTHRRPITNTPSWVERLLSLRYAPFTGKISSYKATMTLRPSFNRDGRPTYMSYLQRIVFLGADSLNGALKRSILLLVLIAVYRKVQQRKV